jgi:hypothetical protein
MAVMVMIVECYKIMFYDTHTLFYVGGTMVNDMEWVVQSP